MKLRLHLLKHLTAEDILEEAVANNHRYKPEPLFARTGVGSLSPASEKERLDEIKRSTALITKVRQRAAAEKSGGKRSSPPPKSPARSTR